MKLKTTLTLSVGTALFLLTGCGSGSTQTLSTLSVDQSNDLQTPISSVSAGITTSSQPGVSILEGLAQSIPSEGNSTVEENILHIADGDVLHLVADEQVMGVTGTVESYTWYDMDGNILSENKTLDRALYYDPNFDKSGMTKYIKTIVITTNEGKTFSESYTVYVHKEGLTGGQALLGPLAQAKYTLRKLDSNTSLYEGTTSQGDGQDITTAGVIPVPANILNTLAEGYYIVKVTGGSDVDRNDDLVWDKTPTQNHGTIQAILTADQIKTGHYKVNIFTHAIYQYLSSLQDLSQYTSDKLTSMMNQLASELIASDLNGDGKIDYSDVIQWNPATDKNKLTINYEKEVAPYVAQIISGKSAALNSEYVVEKRIEGNKEILYTYDAHGNKLTETITENNSEAEPVITVIHYTNVYDDAGRLIEQKNSADTTVIRWIYDAEGNLTERDKGVYENDQTFNAFDRYYYKNGKLDSASLDRGESPYTITYETDQYGNVTKETVLWNGTEYTTEYTYEYDAAGHVLKKYKNGDLLFEQTWKRL